MIPCFGLGIMYGLAPTIAAHAHRAPRHVGVGPQLALGHVLGVLVPGAERLPELELVDDRRRLLGAPAEHEHARQVDELLELRAALREAQRGARAGPVELHRQARAPAPVDRAEGGDDVRDAALELGHVGLAEARGCGPARRRARPRRRTRRRSVTASRRRSRAGRRRGRPRCRPSRSRRSRAPSSREPRERRLTGERPEAHHDISPSEPASRSRAAQPRATTRGPHASASSSGHWSETGRWRARRQQVAERERLSAHRRRGRHPSVPNASAPARRSASTAHPAGTAERTHPRLGADSRG